MDRRFRAKITIETLANALDLKAQVLSKDGSLWVHWVEIPTDKVIIAAKAQKIFNRIIKWSEE